MLPQNGQGPLFSASQEGHTEVVDILLKHGADPNITSTVWEQMCVYHVYTMHNVCSKGIS